MRTLPPMKMNPKRTNMTNVSKTVAERLRKAASEGRSCQMFANAVGMKCEEFEFCHMCAKTVLETLADQIEVEQAELRSQNVDLAALDLLCDKLECGDANHRATAEQIRKAMNGAERTKTEHDGVDVDALLLLADVFRENFAGQPSYESFILKPCEFSEWENMIRNAVKGVTGSKSTPLNASNPMPLDADGEPCWLDDAVWHKGRKNLVVAVSHKGKVCIRDWEKRNSGEGAVWVKAERVTHKEPEVLDADGVPIKVGDTVYTVKGKELVVKDIQRNFFEDGEEPEHLVWCGEYIKEGYPLHQIANQLTHREPDTKESVRALIVEAVKADYAVNLLSLFERYDQAALREAGE